MIGREIQMQYMTKYYQKLGSQIMVLYGQEQVGKTSFIKEFGAEKPFYYYLGRSVSEREQTYLWGQELESKGIQVSEYPSYSEILEKMICLPSHKKVIVIDEFQFLVKNNLDFFTELIACLKKHSLNQQVFIILCSSSIGFIEHNFVQQIGSMALSISGFLKLKPINFCNFTQIYHSSNSKEAIETYAVLGGLAGNWQFFRENLSLQDNICEQILNKRGHLYYEGSRYVESELRETTVYNTILHELAKGRHKLNDLHLHTGFSRAKISVYLKQLIALELVEKIFSYEAKVTNNTQKGIYRIKNPFLHFWFRYLYAHKSELELLDSKQYYKTYIDPSLSSYVNEYYSGICSEAIQELNDLRKLPLKLEHGGKWIGKSGMIDYLGQDSQGQCLVMLASWKPYEFSFEDYEWLLYTIKQAKINPAHIYLFSETGFHTNIVKISENNDRIHLCSIEKIMISNV